MSAPTLTQKPIWKPCQVRAKLKATENPDGTQTHPEAVFQGWETGPNDPLPIASFDEVGGEKVAKLNASDRRIIHRASGLAVCNGHAKNLLYYHERLMELPLDWSGPSEAVLAQTRALPDGGEEVALLNAIQKGTLALPAPTTRYHLPIGVFEASWLARALPALAEGTDFEVLGERAIGRRGRHGNAVAVANLLLVRQYLAAMPAGAIVLCEAVGIDAWRTTEMMDARHCVHTPAGAWQIRARWQPGNGFARLFLPLGLSEETCAAAAAKIGEAASRFANDEPVSVERPTEWPNGTPMPAARAPAAPRAAAERPRRAAPTAEEAARPAAAVAAPRVRASRPAPVALERKPLPEGLPAAALTPLAKLSGVPGLEGWTQGPDGYLLESHGVEVAKCDGGWWWREVGGPFVIIGTGIPFQTPKLCLYWLQRSYVPEWRTGSLDSFLSTRVA